MKKDLPTDEILHIQEVHNGTDVKRYINGKQDIEQEIMEMFDKKFPYGVQEQIGTNWNDCTPKTKSFISHIITLVQKREREEIVTGLQEIVDEPYVDDSWHKGELEAFISLITTK